MDYAARRNKLRKQLAKTGADALLVTNEPNVTYLTGFTGDSSYLLLSPHDEIVLSDARYTTQLEEECPGLPLEIRRTPTKMHELVEQVVKKAKLGKLAIEAASVTLAQLETWEKQMPKIEFVSTTGDVERLREIKDKEEVGRIREAIHLAERAFEVIRAALQPEQTEREIAHQLEHQIRLFGGDACAFKPIVAVGPRAALPHATPGMHQVREDNLLLIDWGARSRLYLSDLTRVLVTGKISPKLERIYGVVLKAQEAAIGSIKPGVALQDVDAAARSVIAKAGHDKQFGHGLGHGIGLEIHESPRLGPEQDQPLKAGMVITIEPGIYVPSWGGIRIEDDVLVTRGGCEVLSSVPKQLADCVIAN